jgi:VIT1/CCC1 family predicted Fe2+/Mn2+ transporter
MIKISPGYFRNVIFGIEDSFVSTVGLLFGMAAAGMENRIIITTGLILLSVEALSMGVGTYLSEESTNEVSHRRPRETPEIEGILMFISYFVAGFVPLAPYMLLSQNLAKYISVVLTLIGLFLLGYIPAKRVKSGFRMTIIAGGAIVLGYFIGRVLGVEAY